METTARGIADPYLGTRANQCVLWTRVKKSDLLRHPVRNREIVVVLPRNTRYHLLKGCASLSIFDLRNQKQPQA
jgi:hypothetical protein